MKYIIFIVLFFCAANTFSQQPVGVPTQKINGWIENWYTVPDSGTVVTRRDTLWVPRFFGTTVTWPRPGIDTTQWYWVGNHWLQNGNGKTIDTLPLHNQIILKLNISDTANMLLPYLRKADTTNKWVQNVYSRNDSLFRQKNGTETFINKFSTGAGTVTSVGLSMPSAFNVSPSTITSSGIFGVTGTGTSLEYIKGNGTLGTFDTAAIPNFYLKVRSLFSGSNPISYNSTTGVFSILNANTSGQKGAATFSSADFTDNGSGLISLRTPNIGDIDVFLVAGQSNQVGQGDSISSPDVYSGYVLQVNNGIISDANDIVGVTIGASENAANTGSAWPSFGNTYFNVTSRKICFIPSSRNGSSMASAANIGVGTWDTTGVLFDSAVARVINNMAALSAQGYNPIFKGVLWGQGETDGLGINSGAIVQATYIDAFTKMIRRFRQQFSYRMPFYIFRTGTYLGQQDSGFAQIRQAQQYVADNDSLTTMVFYNAIDFPARGLMKDNVHYTQVGLNEMGRLGALAVLNNIKRIWQPQDTAIYYPNGRVGIGVSIPQFRLEVKDHISTDSLIGGRANADSIAIFGSTSGTLVSGIGQTIKIGRNMFYREIGSALEGFIGLGARPDYGFDVDIRRSQNDNIGIRIFNPSTSSAANNRILFQNSGGFLGQLFMTNSNAVTFGANRFQLHAGNSVILRIAANDSSIEFARSPNAATPPFLTLKGGTNNFVYNATTDNASLGKFQVYSTSVFDSAMRLNRVTLPPSTYNMLVHGLTDSVTYQITPVILASNTSFVHSIDAQYVDVNNSGTSVTDIYSTTVPASTLSSNGSRLSFEAAGTFNDAAATVNLQLLFAGNSIGGTGAIALTGTSNWTIRGKIWRTSSTAARMYVSINVGSTTAKIFESIAVMGSLDFTISNILKLTAQATGSGGSDDITGQMWDVTYYPAP